MANNYLDNLVAELEQQGIHVPESEKKVLRTPAEEMEAQVIESIERASGRKFSDEQRKILEHHGSACILACAGSGKALVNGTGVLTPDGYVPIESLMRGDKVLDENGEIQTVLGVFPQGKKQVYNVIFENGDIIKCCKDHLWTIFDELLHDRSIVTTLDIKRLLESENRATMYRDGVSIPNISEQHKAIPNSMFETIAKVIEREIKVEDSLDNGIKEQFYKSHNINDLCHDIISNSFDGKIYIKSETLLEVIKFYLEFNGMLVKNVDYNNYYFNIEFEEQHSYCRTIVNVEKTEDFEEMTCIKVSGESELFLTEHCIVTHNTTTSISLIAKRILTREIPDVNRLIYTTYSKAGATEMKERLDALLKQLGMGHLNVKVQTIHAFFLSVLRTFSVNSGIISSSERSRMIREACKEVNFVTKDDDLAILDNLLSYQVNNLLSDKKTIDSYVNTLDDLSIEQYKQIRKSYANKKQEKGLIDYDDMQTMLYTWLIKWASSSNPAEVEMSKNVRQYCKAVYNNFYIDEAQDVSKIQFAIIRAMVEDYDNKGKLDRELVFIGDDDQCLPEGTEIITSNGIKHVEDIQPWDKVLAGVGHGDTSFEVVDNVSKKYIEDNLIEIHTASGKVIRATKNHIGFTRIEPSSDMFYTYLMYKHDIGFRIGTTSGVRAGNRGELRNGIDVRLMQERSDKIWIIKTSNTREESLYWEAYYAYKYSIPMYRFVVGDGETSSVPKTSLNIEQVTKLHKELNTFENGIRLLDDLGMFYEYPHRIPQAEGSRCKINNSWFTTKTKNKYGVHNSEISINTSNKDFIDTFSDILSITDRSTSTKYNYANGRRTDSNIDEQESIINTIVSRCKNKGIYVEVDKDAKFTEDKYMPMPFGNMIIGMSVPIIKETTNEYGDTVYEVVNDTIVDIKKHYYKGYVYDLSVPDIRNFSANEMIVHNCIYQWRGSDPSIILSISATFNMRTFVLNTNYRCHKAILEYSSMGIRHNGSRYDKNMNAFNDGGDVRILPVGADDLCTISIAAMNHIKYWLANGYGPKDIAVLCRNNFHLAILSNMLLREGIYCNVTEDMKLTKSYMYKSVKDIISISEPTWKKDLTASVLWRLCRYMGASVSAKIAMIQDSCALSLEDILGYIVKNFIDKDIEFSKKLSINLQADQEIKMLANRLSEDTKADISIVYKALTLNDRQEAITTLLFQYLSASSFLYKSKDKNRSIRGLVKYIINLMKKDGVDKMIDFLRVTEQFEGGTMVIPGEKVTLTTMHSAKGREWKNVIMFACDNVSQPSFDGISTLIKDDVPVADIFDTLDEDRRLFYVGNTRAIENLLVLTYMQPSIFILEALGAFGTPHNNNAKILELVSDNNWCENYKSVIDNMILDDKSPYYYDSDKYTIK